MFNEKSKLVEKNYCPICDKYLEFEPFGPYEREYSKCPSCESLERHRLTYLFFQGESFNQKPIKLLHLTPEKVFYNYFKNQQNIDYYPVDTTNPKLPESENVELEEKISIEKIPYPNNEFDLIYNEHILQYIEDHYNETITLDEISRHFGYSKYYFSRLFNRTFHCTLNAYINSVRVRAVSKMPEEQSKTEKIIEAGFNSLSSYYRTKNK